MSRINVVIVGDSRITGFEAYSRRELSRRVRIFFIAQRGAKIDDLCRPTIELIRSLPLHEPVIVKLAAGINNLTQFKNIRQNNTLVSSRITRAEVFQELISFKQTIKRSARVVLVGIVNIPVLSFEKYHNYKGYGRVLTRREIDHEQLRVEQILDQVNKDIERENGYYQTGFVRGPRSVYWDRTVRRSSKRRNRDNHMVTTVRSHFRYLYDGLHATSYLKHKWFGEMCRAINKEITTLESDEPRS